MSAMPTIADGGYGVAWEYAWMKTKPYKGKLPDGRSDAQVIDSHGPERPTTAFLIEAINEPGGGISAIVADMVMVADLESRVAG